MPQPQQTGASHSDTQPSAEQKFTLTRFTAKLKPAHTLKPPQRARLVKDVLVTCGTNRISGPLFGKFIFSGPFEAVFALRGINHEVKPDLGFSRARGLCAAVQTLL